MSQGTELQEVCEENRSKRPQFTGFCGLILLVGRSRVKSLRSRKVMVTNTIQAATRKMPVDGLIPRARSCKKHYFADNQVFEYLRGRTDAWTDGLTTEERTGR